MNIANIYLWGMLIWFLYFTIMGGFKFLKEDYISILMIIVFLTGFVILGINYYFTKQQKFHDIDREISFYANVERNAAITMGLLLGVSVFVSFTKTDKDTYSMSLTFAGLGFLILLIGVLNIIWVPTNDVKYINAMKHIKTVIMTIGLLSVAMAMALVASYHMRFGLVLK